MKSCTFRHPGSAQFQRIFRQLKPYAKQPEELRMVIGPRAGPVIFLQGDEVELIPRK